MISYGPAFAEAAIEQLANKGDGDSDCDDPDGLLLT
jgi:hypothetical protein